MDRRLIALLAVAAHLSKYNKMTRFVPGGQKNGSSGPPGAGPLCGMLCYCFRLFLVEC